MRDETTQNPYVERAYVYVKRVDSHYSSIAYLELSCDYALDEDPTILRCRDRPSSFTCLSGVARGRERLVFYRTWSRLDAEYLRRQFMEGQGYAVAGRPVRFATSSKGQIRALERMMKAISQEQLLLA